MSVKRGTKQHHPEIDWCPLGKLNLVYRKQSGGGSMRKSDSSSCLQFEKWKVLPCPLSIQDPFSAMATASPLVHICYYRKYSLSGTTLKSGTEILNECYLKKKQLYLVKKQQLKQLFQFNSVQFASKDLRYFFYKTANASSHYKHSSMNKSNLLRCKNHCCVLASMTIRESQNFDPWLIKPDWV